MSEKNYLNETVVPRMPKSVSNEQLFIFVPVASDAVAGILKVNRTDFYQNRLPVLKIVESESLVSTILDPSGESIPNPKYNANGYARAGIIKSYVDAADKALKDNVDLKQDKNLSKTIAEATTVEGALSNLDASVVKLKSDVNVAEGDINTLKNADEGLANRINNLEQSAYVGETPIGTYPSGATLPTPEQLTAFVQQEVSRAPKLGDVVLFTQIVTDGTDKSYKFMYTETGWSNYVVSILEKLSNTPGTSDTDGYTQKAVNGIVQNPNLLINPNFAINQRGQTSYTETGYTVDRWTLDAGGTLTPQNDGIKLIGACRQFYEEPNQLWGKTVTLSFKTASGITSKSGMLPKVAPSSNITLVSTNTDDSGVNAIIRHVGNKIAVVISATTETKIYWAKVEIGSVATEFSPPSIAEELQKCYRYYKKITNLQQQTYSGLGIAYGDGSGARMNIEGTFRTVPTVTSSGSFAIVANGAVKTISSMAMQSFNSTNVVVKFTLNSALADGLCGYLLSNNSPGAYIALDAEI